MMAQRVERQVIRPVHPKYKVIDEMCLKSKDLYNYANYIIRQEFINNNKYIPYRELNRELKTHQPYKDCMSQPANCVLRVLDKNWKSYFVAIKDWKKNPDKYLGMPKLPGYLPKDGRFNWIIPNNTVFYKDDEIYFRIKKLQGFSWKSRCLGRLIQIRFVPKNNNYIMEVVYEIEVEDTLDQSSRIIAIDLGVDNLATVTNNIGERPFIINGRPIKSVNQYYNKYLAEEKSRLKKINGKDWSRKLDAISFKRNNRITDYLHKASAYIIKWCLIHEVDTIVIGLNKKWKQEANIGRINNQKFIMIPYEKFIQQLEYKCQTNGIIFKATDEAYTSGTSNLDDEKPIKENYNNKRRIERGLFQANDTLINADVNGSLQIMRKVFPNFYTGYGIEVDLTPYVVDLST